MIRIFDPDRKSAAPNSNERPKVGTLRQQITAIVLYHANDDRHDDPDAWHRAMQQAQNREGA